MIELNYLRFIYATEVGYTTFKGSKDKKYHQENFGQLKCQVQGGKAMKIDKANFSFESDSTGQLMFFPNCDLDGIEPEGSLSIKIFGEVKESDQKDINSLTGYSSLPGYSKEEYPYITKEEFDLFEMINKARTNPKRFSELFINNDDDDHKELINFLQNYSNVPPLSLNQELTQAAYSHCSNLGTNGLSGHISDQQNINISNRVQQTYKSNFSYFG